MFTDEIINKIVENTNKRLRHPIVNTSDEHIENEKTTHFYETDKDEILAFIGLWYMYGLLNQSLQ